MDSTFAELGIEPPLIASLAAAEITEPLPIQALTIPDALAGLDLCGRAKTGSGKTLAFGLPILQRLERAEPTLPHALVVSPTRELAVQISEVLAQHAAAVGLRVASLYGGVSLEPQIKQLKSGVDIAVATPGRLLDLLSRQAVSLAAVQIVVLDEADRLADMGFLPDVRRILDRCNKARQTMLFSATLDNEVASIVARYMRDPVHHEVASPTKTVDSMSHRFFVVEANTKAAVTAEAVAGARRPIVFVRTKHGVDRLVRQLRDLRVDAEALHGGLPQGVRKRAMDRFGSDHPPVLVATDLAARGLDIDGVDLVVHYDPPDDEKVYLHRSGRTARAGASGVVVSLLLRDQVMLSRRLQQKLHIDVPTESVVPTDERLSCLFPDRDDQPVRPAPPRRPAPTEDRTAERRSTTPRRNSGERRPSAARVDGSRANPARPRHTAERPREVGAVAVKSAPADAPVRSPAPASESVAEPARRPGWFSRLWRGSRERSA